jgi:serine/threonine protein kinase/tetratricopeptide (TPR) repeat protein
VRPGEVIARRFEIERKIGVGGMGTVYRALDRDTGKPVAVKRLDISGKHDAERFNREASVLAELRHPSIVRYVAHGKTERGDHYIAMEWLDGETLHKKLSSGKLAIIECVQLGMCVATALAEAHRHGVIHRDIKPPNIFLVSGAIDRAKLLDFGVARLTGHESAGAMTRTGALIGTPGYMAPEQARGEKEILPSADVFALGSVMFECLAAKPPFYGANVMAVLAKILLEEAPRTRELRPEVPRALDELIASMLAKEPAGRPKDGRAVADALATLSFGEVSSESSIMPTLRDEEPPERPPALTTNEQRVISVVLAGQPEGTAETWTPDQARIRGAELIDIVESFEGQAEPLMDGTLLVSLTGKGAATDLAVRAARCALVIKDHLQDVPIVLAMGRGVITGRMPFGEVIDRAAIALAEAGSGVIRLDRISANLLDGAGFEIGTDAKGLVLQREVEPTTGKRTLLGKPTQCAGRDRELLNLEALFVECIGEPLARAVLITGPPGIGKSRVRFELLEKVKARCEEMEVLTARGDSLRAGSPFAMLAEAINRSAGIAGGDPIEVRREKLRARLLRHAAAEDVGRIAAFLGELAGIPFPDEAHEALRAARQDAMLMGDGMRAAFEDWLEAECRAYPVILVLEDLQWGDLPTVKLIDATLRNLSESPLLVLAVARPEVYESFPGLWAERNLEEIKLGPLSKKACEKLAITALLGTGKEDRLRLCVEKADGNPFFLEELVRAVAAGADDRLPETVLGMVQARLDALGTEAKRVLRAASVFGNTFWRGGVMALLGGGDSTARVSDWLEDVVDREIVAKNANARFPREVEYTFRQTLVREAAHAMLTDHDLALGHRLAGLWLESQGERDATVLAEHFDRGGEPQKALLFYKRGAEQALEASDFGAAIQRANFAIDRGASGELLGSLHQILGEAYVWRGEPAEAEKHLDVAARLMPQGSIAWFRAVGEIVASIVRQGAIDRLDPWIEAAGTAQPAEGAVGAQIVCLARTAENALLVGRYKDVDRLAKRIQEIEKSAPTLEPLSFARVHRFRARRALHSGDPAAYAIGLLAANKAFEGAGDIRNATNERMNLGFAYAELGEYARAEDALRHAQQAAKRMGLFHVLAWADNNLGNVLGRRGEIEQAREVEARAVDAGRAQGDPRLEGNSRIYLSLIAERGGDLASAEKEAREAAGLLGGLPALKSVALAARARALVGLQRGPEALSSAKEAMDLLEELGAIEEGESLVRLGWAESLHAAGDRDKAVEAIAHARDRLYVRASRITEPAWRDSFLKNIPENARTLQLAGEWGAPESGTLRET